MARREAPGLLDRPRARFDPRHVRRHQLRWSIDVSRYAQGQERRQGGRVDHTLTYERPSPTLNEGRYRLRLVVSGNRLTEVAHFIKIAEAFSRRYENMRSANQAIGIASVVGMALIYVLGGIGVGLFFMMRTLHRGARRLAACRGDCRWTRVVVVPRLRQLLRLTDKNLLHLSRLRP